MSSYLRKMRRHKAREDFREDHGQTASRLIKKEMKRRALARGKGSRRAAVEEGDEQ